MRHARKRRVVLDSTGTQSVSKQMSLAQRAIDNYRKRENHV